MTGTFGSSLSARQKHKTITSFFSHLLHTVQFNLVNCVYHRFTDEEENEPPSALTILNPTKLTHLELNPDQF